MAEERNAPSCHAVAREMNAQKREDLRFDWGAGRDRGLALNSVEQRSASLVMTEPLSVHFAHRIGLAYVSCSPVHLFGTSLSAAWVFPVIPVSSFLPTVRPFHPSTLSQNKTLEEVYNEKVRMYGTVARAALCPLALSSDRLFIRGFKYLESAIRAYVPQNRRFSLEAALREAPFQVMRFNARLNVKCN